MGPTRAEIDLSALSHNFHSLRRKLRPGAGIIGVVKANAYGHGAVGVARRLEREGAASLAVATLSEAMELRENGVRSPLLLLYQLDADPKTVSAVVREKFQVAVCSLPFARALSRAACRSRRRVPIHLKVDIGMARFGVWPGEFLPVLRQLSSLPGLEVKGVFSHFPAASSTNQDDRYRTQEQIRLFSCLLRTAEKNGFSIPAAHMANSAALISFPSSHFDMVRPGLALYGLYPGTDPETVLRKRVSLKPVLSLKTQVVYLKRVPRGAWVGYGHTYRARKNIRIAILPVGYGDGLPRRMGNRGAVLIRGQRMSLAGAVCMDSCMVELGPSAAQVRPGDEAVLLGRQGGEEITAEEIAGHLDTINYEVTTQISRRVQRIFTD